MYVDDLRRIYNGRCRDCNKPRVTGSHCRKHAIRFNTYQREQMRRRLGTKRHFSKGQPRVTPWAFWDVRRCKRPLCREILTGAMNQKWCSRACLDKWLRDTGWREEWKRGRKAKALAKLIAEGNHVPAGDRSAYDGGTKRRERSFLVRSDQERRFFARGDR